MASYSKNNFIIPVGDEGVNLRIRDIRGQERHTVWNSTNTTFFNQGSSVLIRTDGDNSDIVLDFGSTIEAIQALSLLNKEYAKIKKNFETKKKNDLIEDLNVTLGEVKQYVFSSEPDANVPLFDNQVSFQLPSNTSSISTVTINGVAINDYEFNTNTKILTIDPILIGYPIEESDELMVKYF